MLKNKYINSGEIYFSETGEVINTNLGSCVAVCLYDEKRKCGGMTHYFLPENDGVDNKTKANLYGESAILNLLKIFKQKGSNRHDLTATILGGNHNHHHIVKKIAEENVLIAQQILTKFGIPVKKNKVNSEGGIRIKFYTDSGDIFLTKNAKKSHYLDLIVIGSSTGGTEFIRDIAPFINSECPPIAIVQHMPSGFTDLFAESLNMIAKVKVKEIKNGELLLKGHVYIAPGGKQVKIVKSKEGEMRFIVTNDPPVNLFKPSVDYLFDSVAKISGIELIAMLFTGMGSDGALGLKKLHDLGIETFVQDEKSSVVFGMPKAAIELGGVDAVLGKEDIAQLLSKKISTEARFSPDQRRNA